MAREDARKNRMRTKNVANEIHERVPGDGVGEYEIGAHEYAIAKRAAKKMIEFMRNR